MNSGIFDASDLQAQTFSFSTRIDANPGAQFTFLCLIHLGMRQTVSVVADTETPTTQAEIDTYRDEKVTLDARKAGKLHASLLQGTPSSGGVVDAYAGYDGPHFSLLAFYPRKIELTKGQTVRWHFDALMFEDHTVTFPSKKALKIANNSFIPVCDPDGDTGTMPDEPSDPNATTIDDVCPGGVTQIEFAIDPRFGPPAGNGVATGIKDLESSGIRGANVGLSDPVRGPVRQANGEARAVHVHLHGPPVHEGQGDRSLAEARRRSKPRSAGRAPGLGPRGVASAWRSSRRRW